MAHGCIHCGAECFCNGDIDDVVTTLTPKNCEGCGCETDEWDDEDEEEDVDFTPCSKCDGHQACEDFGCAIEHGLVHLLERDPTDL